MYKSLFYHPGNPSIVYASGQDVYRSIDGGLNWTSMTAAYPGLDLAAISARRIALGIESIPPYTLYANICRLNGSTYQNYPARFDQQAEAWSVFPQAAFTCTNNNPAWVCIAVRPGHTGTVAFGNTQLAQSTDGGQSVALVDTYSQFATPPPESHGDKHGLAYSPDGGELWIGCDGGAYMTEDVTAVTMATCTIERKNTGLGVSTILAMGSNPAHPEQVLIGTFDDANQLHRRTTDGQTHEWRYVDGGDGGAVCFSPDGSKAWTWVFNSRSSFKKYLQNSPVTGPSSGGSYYFTMGSSNGLADALIPVEIPPMGFRPGSNQWTFAAHNLYVELDPNDAPNIAADFDQFSVTAWADLSDYYTLECLSYSLNLIAIHPRYPDYIYYSTRAELVDEPSSPCYPVRPSAIFASQRDEFGGLLDWDHRFATLNMPSEWEEDPMSVSGLAVDPRDPLHLYVGFSGYNNDVKVYEAYLNPNDPYDTYWATLDIDHSLPNLPVTDLVYADGTAGGLYVSFDVGIYYKNENEGQWQPYFEALPNVQISDIDINYCTGKLRAGTFGRGLWESDLAEKPHLARVVAMDETWAYHVNLGSDLHVTNGATLTISSTVNFAPDTRLIIDPGAHVILMNGGKLTNLCGKDWDRVEVRGVSTEDQSPLSNQGYLELRAGAVIEHAKNGICLYGTDAEGEPDLATTGGVLRSTGSSTNPVIIRNCGQALHMLPYENHPGGGAEQGNRTRLTYTVMETDAGEISRFVGLEDVYGVIFNHCTFRDNASSPDWAGESRPNGIESFSSKFTVTNSTFWRLRTGIEASNDGLLNPAFVRNNTFDLCHWGILLDGVHASEVTSNTFIVPQGHVMPGQDPLTQIDPPLGLYLHTCEGYEVEENNFASDQPLAVGLVVTDNSSGANQFYRNTFNGLLVGSLLQGDNRDVDGQGLQCLCNDYGLETDNVYKIALTWGGEIAQFQGTPANFNDPAVPAGNRFNPECAAGTDESDIYVQDDGQLGFTYLRHNDAICDPACRTSGFVNVVNTNQFFQDDVQQSPSCPSQLGHGHYVNDHLLKYALFKQAYTQLKAYLAGELDGGDTPDLLAMIEDDLMSTFNLRLELLAASPRLTDRVMIAAIQREPAMDPWHLAQVLLANSPLTPDVLLTLDRSDVLPTYRDMVAAAQTGGLSLKSMLEAELAGYRLGMEGPRYDAVRYYLERDTIGNPLDSVLLVLGDPVVPSAAFNVACLHIERGDWSAGDAIVANAATNGLDAGSIQVLEVLTAIGQDPAQSTALVLAAAPVLTNAATSTTIAGAAARGLLAQHTGASFEHPVVLPGSSRPRSYQEAPPSAKLDAALTVMPNPASTAIRIVVKQPVSDAIGMLQLYDAQGRSLRQWPLGSGMQLLEEDVSAYPTGQYRLRLIAGDGSNHSATFQIAR